jgi:hypothetical protein
LVSCIACAVPVTLSTNGDAQTVFARYAGNEHSRSEIFAFDFDSGAALRIDSAGRVMLVTPEGEGFEGIAGLASLEPSEQLNRTTAPGIVLPALPGAGLYQLEHFRGFGDVQSTGPFDGPVVAGDFPLGDPTLGQPGLLPPDHVFESMTCSYILDASGYLREIRLGEDRTTISFDFEPTRGPREVAVASIGQGDLTLQEHRVTEEADLSIFKAPAVIELSRSLAFERAEAERMRQREEAMTDAGRRRMEQARSKQFEESPLVRMRGAIILTGFALATVGLFAWWKRR